MKARCFLIILTIAGVEGANTTEEPWQNAIFEMPDLRAICGFFNNVSDVDEQCAEQLNIVCGNITLLLKMVDASSKFPYTGLGYASQMDVGNFDQCMAISHSYEGGRILGEFCTQGLLVPDPFKNMSDESNSYVLAVCRPNACTADDYEAVVQDLLDPDHPEYFSNEICTTAKRTEAFKILEILPLAILVIVILLMVMSTTYDVYLYTNHITNVHPLLTAFSVLSNGRKLLHVSTSKEHIQIFNGFRVISMMWIMAGHAYMTWDEVPLSNKKEWGTGTDFGKHLYTGYILAAVLAVDTFFFMSGFLVAFLYLKHKKKSLMSQVISVPKMYIHRYLRLTTPLLVVCLTGFTIFTHFGNGPLWLIFSNYTTTICKENWWALLLYCQNYHNYDRVCFPQMWFLSAIMQLFLISPLILIPVTLTLKKPSGFKKAMIALMILNIFGTFMPLAHRLSVKYLNEFDSHSRLIDYSIGITLAVFMREKMEEPFLYTLKEHRRPVVNFITWVLVVFVMLLTVICYQLIEIDDRYNAKAIYHSFMRPVWCTGLSWMVYSSHHGYGGFVHWILCRPIFQVLGRLTFCIYLVHQTVIDYYAASRRSYHYLTDYTAFYLYCGHYIMSVIFAIFWTLAFESPLVVLQKYLMSAYDPTSEGKSTSPQTQEDGEAQLKDITSNLANENLSVKDVDSGGLYRKRNELL